jgi:hypothetical protein
MEMYNEFEGTGGEWLVNTTALEPNKEILITDEDGRGICRMPKEVLASEFIKAKSKAETMANAKLIANAPRVLKELQRLVFLHTCEQEGIGSGMPTPKEWIEAVEEAHQSIQKSLGYE